MKSERGRAIRIDSRRIGGLRSNRQAAHGIEEAGMPHIGIEGQSFADRSAHQKWKPSHEPLRPPGKMHKRLRTHQLYQLNPSLENNRPLSGMIGEMLRT